MRRRELMLVAGGAVMTPHVLFAEQKAMPVIGFLSSASAGPFAPFVAAFHQGLSDTGYIEGQKFSDRVPLGRRVTTIGYQIWQSIWSTVGSR